MPVLTPYKEGGSQVIFIFILNLESSQRPQTATIEQGTNPGCKTSATFASDICKYFPISVRNIARQRKFKSSSYLI